MSSVPLFSVVVPTYGRPVFLAEAVQSVLAQTIRDFECIVVDDASGEPPTVPADPRVRVVHRDVNGGAAAARNTGLAEATGRYVTFLDDDDVYLPERLEQAAGALDRAEFLVSFKGAYGHPHGPPLTARVLDGDVGDTILDAAVPHLGTCTLARHLAVRFDERFRVSEDVEWWLRQAAAAPVATVAQVGYLQRAHGGARQTSRISERLRCRLLLLEVHADWFAAHPRAASQQWKRAGGLALRTGDRSTARRAFRQSLKAHPDVAAIAHLARASLRR